MKSNLKKIINHHLTIIWFAGLFAFNGFFIYFFSVFFISQGKHVVLLYEPNMLISFVELLISSFLFLFTVSRFVKWIKQEQKKHDI